MTIRTTNIQETKQEKLQILYFRHTHKIICKKQPISSLNLWWSIGNLMYNPLTKEVSHMMANRLYQEDIDLEIKVMRQLDLEKML